MGRGGRRRRDRDP